MRAPEAAEQARRPIERLAVLRYQQDLPELRELHEEHGYFFVYAVGRTAAVGGGPRLAHALLALFPAGLVAKAFERVDGVASVRERYVEACAAAGQRVHADLPDAGELAERLESIVERTDLADRPLAAGWAELPTRSDVGARIERAATVLREHRGNGHVSVLTAHGLAGAEALLLTALWRGDDDPTANARFFGWRDDDLTEAWVRLQEAGRIDGSRQLTSAGREERQAIEDRTADLAAGAWQGVEPEDRARTVELLQRARTELKSRR